MKPVFFEGDSPLLQKVADANTLLAFDFDGTLAPLVRDRELAAPRLQTLLLFQHLCRLYPCAVISGRSRDDVRRRLGKAQVRFVIGNHGLEPGTGLAEFQSATREARLVLEKELPRGTGIEIEDKVYSLAIHYRAAADKARARRRVQQAVARLGPAFRSIDGKLVVNAVPAAAPNKGEAVLSLRQRLGIALILFVGDDVTDEDVFSLPKAHQVFSVRVGRSVRSAAGWYLRGQLEIDRLLERLIALRVKSAAPHA